jgi:hypothetical protein
MEWLKWINPKTWFEGILIQKVIGKFVKHCTGAVVGFVTGPWFAAKIAPILNQLGVTVDWNSFSTGLEIFLIGAFGAAWNWIQHRFFKKTT